MIVQNSCKYEYEYEYKQLLHDKNITKNKLSLFCVRVS